MTMHRTCSPVNASGPQNIASSELANVTTTTYFVRAAKNLRWLWFVLVYGSINHHGFVEISMLGGGVDLNCLGLRRNGGTVTAAVIIRSG